MPTTQDNILTKSSTSIFGDNSDLTRLYRSVYNQAKNSQNVEHVIAFTKALAECSIPEGYILTNAIEDVRNNVKSIDDLKNIWNTVLKKHPEYMVCLPLIIAGLTIFISENTKDIYAQVKKFYKGAISILPTIAKGITKALGENSLSEIGNTALDQLIDSVTSIGLGYLLYWENKAIDKVEEKAMNAVATVGRSIALYMTVFVEFRWAMMMIFIRNVKDQIDSRVKRLNDVAKAIHNLRTEAIASSGTQYQNERRNYLAKYKAALQKLEDTIPIVQSMEKDLYKRLNFSKNINDRVLKNFNEAEGLLLKERNAFLEKFVDIQKQETDTDRSWRFYLSNDYSKTTVIQSPPPAPIFWDGDPRGEFVNLERVLVSIKNKSGNNNISISKPNELTVLPAPPPDNVWVLVNTDFEMTTSMILKIDGKFYTVNQVLLKSLSAPKVSMGQFILIQNTYDTYTPGAVVDFNFPGEKIINVYKELPSGSFGLTFDWKQFNINDGGFTIKDLNSDDTKKAPPYTVDIKQTGIEFVRNIWGTETKDYDFFLFFTTDVNRDGKFEPKYFKMLGIYPNLVEKNAQKAEEISKELPEPLKSLYSQYSNLSNKPLNKFTGNDFLNAGGTFSTFLFGRDIIKDNIYKFKNDVLSYDNYLKTASELLGAMCPLKNNYLYFYSLLNSLENIDTDLDITNSIVLRDWIALNNRILLDTLGSMTARDVNRGNEFVTINAINDSPYQIALVPSALLDIDNIEMMKVISTLDGEMGIGLNKNRSLQKIYLRFIKFIKAIREAKVVEQLQDAENNVWTNIYNSLLTSISLMMEGKSIKNIDPIIKKSNRLLYIVTIRLNELSRQLGYFIGQDNQYTSILADSSMKDFQKFLQKNGLSHFLDYIKNGQWKNFINTNINEWVGKWSPLINCLMKYKQKFGIGGTNKLYIDKIINYLTKWQRGDFLTQYEMDVTGIYKSINLNFVGKLPIGMKTTISTNLKLIETADKVKKQISNTLMTVGKTRTF